jgi:hypothetical protein
MPPTIDRPSRDVPVIPTSTAGSALFECAVTRQPGATRGVGHGPSNGRHVGEGSTWRSRTEVTSRATMSDRPRAGTRTAGLISIIDTERSPPDLFPEAIVVSRQGIKRDGERPPSRNSPAGPVLDSRPRGCARYAPPPQSRAIGIAPYPSRRGAAATDAGSGPAGILPSFPSRVPAARTGEVLRSRDQGASSVP